MEMTCLAKNCMLWQSLFDPKTEDVDDEDDAQLLEGFGKPSREKICPGPKIREEEQKFLKTVFGGKKTNSNQTEQDHL